jgi:pimeloyl-ACP methyl ester carboxylesterase
VQRREARRRTLIAGALAVGAGAGAARRRYGRRADPQRGAREQPPTVTDEEFLADERYIQDGFEHADVGGWKTRIFDRGQGEAILFVPIIRGLEVVYARQLRAFAPTHRVLLYERDETLDRPVYVESRVEEMRRLLDHLEIERAHVVGLGDAGVPTLSFGRYHPDRSLSLTSINLGPRYRMPPYWLTEKVINPLTVKLPVERVVPGAVIRAWVINKTTGDGALPKHLIRHMVEHIPQPMRVHKYSVMPVTDQHEMRDWAHTLDVPTMLIGRDDDPLAPVAELEELAAQLPRCHGLHVLPDGGRFITYTWGERITGLLREFFAAATATTAASADPAAS